MEKNDHAILHHATAAGCRMWTPIIDPVVVSPATAQPDVPRVPEPAAPTGTNDPQGHGADRH